MNSTHNSLLYLEDTGHILVAVSVLFIVLDTLFLALRFYAGKLHKTSVGVDDLVILVAWFTHIGLCILGISMSIFSSPPVYGTDHISSNGLLCGCGQTSCLQLAEGPTHRGRMGEISLCSGVVVFTIVCVTKDLGNSALHSHLFQPDGTTGKPRSDMDFGCKLVCVSHRLLFTMQTVRVYVEQEDSRRKMHQCTPIIQAL